MNRRACKFTSVHSDTMSREVPFRTLLYVFLLGAMVSNTGCVDSLSDRCLELAKLDIDEIQDYLSELNLTDVPTVKILAAGFKCPISALPFGALKSDWSRLLLLQDAQPDGSIVKRKLIRLLRILIIAYFQMEERFDMTGLSTTTTTTTTTKQSLTETVTTALATDDTGKPHGSSRDRPSLNVASNNHYNCTHLCASVTPLTTEDVKTSSSAASVSTKNISSSYSSTTEISYRNIAASSTHNYASAVTVPYNFGNVTDDTAENAQILDNCLKQSFNDILQKYSSNDTRNNAFRRLKNKKYPARAALRPNKIDNDYRKNRTRSSRVSPPLNEFWRYFVSSSFSTRAPLTISAIARSYRMQGLNGPRANPRKSRKRASLNTDVHKSPRRFYDVDKNKEGTK